MHLISSDLDSRFVIPNRLYFDNACEFADITVVKERKNVIIRSITGKVVLVNEVKIQWHPGFVAAMNLEFGENRGDLIYEKEYNLSTKPLEIDLLVIKKDSDVRMVNEIGKLFRGHNIVEYKSPSDDLNIDTFYKAGAYGCLYKALGESVDERAADDITVTMIRDKKPAGLFRYLKEHHIEVSNPYAGIYYVFGEVLFPTQIVVGKELKWENHIWLKALSHRIRKQDMKELLVKVNSLTQKFDRELADSVLEVSIKANKRTVRELRGENQMCKALLEIMEPEINQIVGERTREITKEITEEVTKEVTREVTREVTKAVTKAVTRDLSEETAVKMLKSGKFTVEEIHEYVPRLSIEEIRALKK